MYGYTDPTAELAYRRERVTHDFAAAGGTHHQRGHHSIRHPFGHGRTGRGTAERRA